jgi:anti-sigma28 factor (negative regulator of flagellin synthesis)
MVNSIGANLPTAAQAVNKARNDAQAQKTERSTASSQADEVQLSTEAQELTEVDALARETRTLLEEQQEQILSPQGQSFDALL